MEKQKHISYGFEDIRRYKLGLMSKEEMRVFEQASMEDPFLADALEGYMDADLDLAEEHHSSIARQISGNESRTATGVVVPMQKRSFSMWKVAAMVIVLAGAGLLTYNIFNNDNGGVTDPIAQVENPVTVPQGKPADAASPQQEAAKPNSNESGAGPLEDKRAENSGKTQVTHEATALKDVDEAPRSTASLKPEATPNDVPRVASVEVREKKDQEKAAAPIMDEVAAQNSYNTRKETAELSSRNNQFRGRVLSPENTPVSNANIRLENGTRTFVTDKSGNFVVDAQDTIVNATVASQGYGEARVQLRSDAENTINLGTIQMRQDRAFMDEVVVVGIGTKRVKVSDTATNKPLGGWDSFQDYVARTLGITLDTTNADRHDNSAEIEFFVDSRGIARDIKIFNATNAVKDKEAALREALKNGPKWATRNKKTRILIRY